jgi:hypothetical protein
MTGAVADPEGAALLDRLRSLRLADDQVRRALRYGFALEYATLAWNVAGIMVLAIAAVTARSVALAGFALDSLIEIGASTVVLVVGEPRHRIRAGLLRSPRSPGDLLRTGLIDLHATRSERAAVTTACVSRSA